MEGSLRTFVQKKLNIELNVIYLIFLIKYQIKYDIILFLIKLLRDANFTNA